MKKNYWPVLAQFKKLNLSHIKIEGINYKQILWKPYLIKFLVLRICINPWTAFLPITSYWDEHQLKNEIHENWCATNIDENTVAQFFLKQSSLELFKTALKSADSKLKFQYNLTTYIFHWYWKVYYDAISVWVHNFSVTSESSKPHYQLT